MENLESEEEDSTEESAKLDASACNRTSKRTSSSSLQATDEDGDGEGGNGHESRGKTKSRNDFHRGKTFPDKNKNVQRSNVGHLVVVDSLISSEEHYNSCLRSLVEVFKEPIMVSLETNRALLSWQNARLLFDDVTRLFGISCQFLEDLKLTRKKRPSKISLGQLFLRFLKSFKSLLSAYLLAYPSTLETYDKCKRQSPQFRAFLKRFEHSLPSLMLSMPELYAKPWKRVNEYSRFLVAYRDVIPQDHFDVHDINASLHSLGELQDLLGEVN